MSELDSEIASTTAALENLQQKSSKIERAIQELEKRILEIGGSKLLSQKSKVEGIRLHINLKNDELTKAEVSKNKAEKDISKLENAIETNESVLSEMEGEVEELNGQLEELREYLGELREKVEDAQQAAEHSKDDLDELKKELDEKEDQIADFRKLEVCILA
jgi:structural maintenance of chromosome 4